MLLARASRAAVPVIVAALFVLSGLDRRVEAAITDAIPDWLVRLTTRF